MYHKFWAIALLVLVCPNVLQADEPVVQLLWPTAAPGAMGTEDIDKPTLTLFPAAPEKANGAAVVICPGGGYGHLAVNHEGVQIAQWLNSHGVSAFMLKYRLGPKYHHPAPMLDVQRALRTVRAHAKDWKLDPQRVGIIGFSAGGHLASTAATHFDAGQPDAADEIDRQSCRPDFAILCYPVITMALETTHRGSRNNLLGENPDEALVKLMSNELQVTDKTPPTFLFHTTEDTAVLPKNSLLFYDALCAVKVPAELHIYEKGRHGVGLAADDPVLSTWAGRCIDWLKARGLLEPAKPVAGETVELKLASVTFQIPKAWERVKPRTRIIEAEYSLPKTESEAFDGRMTLMRAAGSNEQNLNRWAGEFSLNGDQAKTAKVKLGMVEVTTVELKGTWKGSSFNPVEPRPEYGLRAAIIPLGGGDQFFIKLIGPEKTLARFKAEFDAFVKSAVLLAP